MADRLENILIKCRCEKYLPVFSENDIDFETLLVLEPPAIEKLTNIGAAARIIAYRKSLTEEKNQPETPPRSEDPQLKKIVAELSVLEDGTVEFIDQDFDKHGLVKELDEQGLIKGLDKQGTTSITIKDPTLSNHSNFDTTPNSSSSVSPATSFIDSGEWIKENGSKPDLVFELSNSDSSSNLSPESSLVTSQKRIGQNGSKKDLVSQLTNSESSSNSSPESSLVASQKRIGQNGSKKDLVSQHSNSDLTPNSSPKSSLVASEKRIRQNGSKKGLVIKDLRAFLMSISDGRALIRLYENKRELFDEKCRGLLVKIIATKETETDPDFIPSDLQFQFLRDEIKSIFTRERPGIYYVPSDTKGTVKVTVKGKLYNAFNDKRRLYLKSELIESRKKPKHSKQPLESETEESAALAWLKNSDQPQNILEEYWDVTLEERWEILKTIRIDEYYKLFPALPSPTGYSLLLRDFEKLYPNLKDGLYLRFPLVKRKIIDFFKKKYEKRPDITKHLDLDTDETDSEEDLTVAALLALPFLLHTTSVPTGKKTAKGKSLPASKGKSKPSMIEGGQGFIFHVKSSSEVETGIEEKKEALKKQKLTLQPVVVLFGPTFREIIGSYVYVNNVRYKFQSPLSAVDVCFKLYQALNAKYPVESYNIWYFLQVGMYRIHLENDKEPVPVNTFLTDLEIDDED